MFFSDSGIYIDLVYDSDYLYAPVWSNGEVLDESLTDRNVYYLWDYVHDGLGECYIIHNTTIYGITGMYIDNAFCNDKYECLCQATIQDALPQFYS